MPLVTSTRASRIGASTALAALAACAVLLPLLGHKPLTDWDEGIYAEVSREMLAHGWLVPHWNAQPWFEKPPLMLWITAAFFRLFGVTEFWARAGSALSAVGVVAVAHAWLGRKQGQLAAWLSTLMLLATFGFLHAARVGETDILLTLGCLAAIIGLERVTAGRGPGWYLFWGGFAVATMTKGAASAVIPLTALGCLAVDRRRLLRFPMAFGVGFVAFLALVAPWHVAMLHLYGRFFVDEYFGLHVWARATSQIEQHHSHWWYYLKVLLVSAPPFCVVYPFATMRALRIRSLRPFAMFALVVVVCFTLVQTRLPHYIAPAYPAFTIVTAAGLAVWLEGLVARGHSRGFWIRLAAAATVVVTGSILVTAHGRRSLHSAQLPSGAFLAGNKDATALLRHAAPALATIPGPLLVWREGRPPIITDVFYARRPVQQVALLSRDSGAPVTPGDRYTNHANPLESAVAARPTLLLLDSSLLSELPPNLRFTPIERDHDILLGWVVRAPG